MITRWQPYSGLGSLQRELNRLFNEPFPGQAEMEAFKPGWNPAVDIREDAEGYYIEADLPGMKKDDVKVNVDRNTLTLSGERKFEKDEKKNGYHRVERAYGSFQRSFSLPTAADLTKVVAEYKDGVLRVRVPKSEQERPRQIDVRAV